MTQDNKDTISDTVWINKKLGFSESISQDGSWYRVAFFYNEQRNVFSNQPDKSDAIEQIKDIMKANNIVSVDIKIF